MKPELEKLSMAFIANRDIVKEAFRGCNSDVYAACANLFCACGRIADKERLTQCRKIITEQTGLFSKFRGKLSPILSCMLALGENPEEQMALAIEYDHLLKQAFKNTEFLVLIAFLLTGSGDKDTVTEKIARGKILYRRMDKEHPILTNDTDSVFAVSLAFSEKTDDALIEDMEACYKALKTKFSSSGDAQTAAQILAVAEGAPEEKAERVIELYNALQESDVEYGRSRELAPLAALSSIDSTIQDLVEEIKEVDAFLKTQKDYESGKDKERAMHAVMIVSDQYACNSHVNSAVMTTTLEMLIAKQKSLYLSLFLQSLQIAGQFLVNVSQESEETTESENAEETEEEDKRGK